MTTMEQPAALTDRARRAKIRANERKIAASQKKMNDLSAKLRPLVVEMVEKTVFAFAHGAPITASMSRPEAVATVQGYLIGAEAIPIPPEIAQMMETVGFDGGLFTAGDYHGQPARFAAGLPLLKFIGLVAEDAPSLDAMLALMSLTEQDSIH